MLSLCLNCPEENKCFVEFSHTLFSPEESAVFFLCDDFFGSLFIALSLDGNLLQLLYRDRGALPAPPGHRAAAVSARLGADGDLERCGYSARSRAARH